MVANTFSINLIVEDIVATAKVSFKQWPYMWGIDIHHDDVDKI